jgi:ABC-type branched-subunit amino acid transport system substrate-binding protein
MDSKRDACRAGRRLAVVALIALVGAGCGSSSHASGTGPVATTGSTATSVAGAPGDMTGVTASAITIGQISTVSGPIPGGGQGAFDGLQAYVDYVNAGGGVDGRKLHLVQKDDALSCANDTNDVKTFSTSTFASVGTFALLDVCEGTGLRANPTLPDIQAYVLDSALLSLPNVTAPAPAPYGYQTTGALWIKHKFPDAIAQTAQLYVALSKTSADNIQKTYESLGYKYVYSRGVGLTETNFTSDVLRMKADGVKIVDMGAVDEQILAAFLHDAAQQNFHPDAIVSAVGYDPNLFKDLGAVGADDLYMPLSYPMFLGQDLTVNPELATLTTWIDKLHPGEVPNLYAVDAWAAGVLFVQALRSGGRSPSRAGLLQALSKIHDFSAGGLLPPANPGGKQGSTCMVIAGISAGKFLRLDPPTKGFECDGVYHNLTAIKG